MMDVLQIAMFALLPLMAVAGWFGVRDIGRALRHLSPAPETTDNQLATKEFSLAA
jgi:hypothetical protein